MCTVLLRLTPGGGHPVLLGAVRDEFVERSWDPPARHWDGAAANLLGGRDLRGRRHLAGRGPGSGAAVAALLNAGRREEPEDGRPRPTRGTLALRILTGEGLPDDLERYDRFHLLRADLDGGELWSWDGDELDARRARRRRPHHRERRASTSTPIPLVSHFAPLLAALPSTPDAWLGLLAGAGLDPGDERALVVAKEIEGRAYGSTSASLVALSPAAVRYDFTATPTDPSWWPVDTGR